jgi:hypothetical protein
MHTERKKPRLGSPLPILLATALIGLAVGCSNKLGPGCTTDCDGGVQPIPGSYTLVGAGDIAVCGGKSELTAKLLDEIPGDVFTSGDNAYPSGTRADFRDCFNPTWGRHKARMHPVPGNHDYEDPGAKGYFEYFGPDVMGPDGAGYYTFVVGSWTIFAINSEVFPLGTTSPQYQWLRNELFAAQTSPCTMAIWHRPLFTSGPNPAATDMRPIFKLLYDNKVDVIINGHDHLYERFAPQDSDGKADPAKGIRQFTVGTGGVEVYQPGPRQPNSERILTIQGVLKMQLADKGFAWDFIPISGPHDTGTGACH